VDRIEVYGPLVYAHGSLDPVRAMEGRFLIFYEVCDGECGTAATTYRLSNSFQVTLSR
jgi:hypothetical protein